MLNVTFHGVRGSTPAPASANQRYGGNTACVVLEAPGQDPVVLDLGTGLRAWGTTLDPRVPLRATALLSHVHWDHVMGLPFLTALHRAEARLEVFGPAYPDAPLKDVVGGLMTPPYFPVGPDQLGADIAFHDLDSEEVAVGAAKVTARPVPHLGPTNGYRVAWEGVTVAYVSDHQAPERPDVVAESVLELADGADLLIHDAQFTAEEWHLKPDWGHCTVDYAVLVAREAGARCLALFHHDPAHSDDQIDRLTAQAQRTAERLGVDEVIAAAEGLTVSFER